MNRENITVRITSTATGPQVEVTLDKQADDFMVDEADLGKRAANAHRVAVSTLQAVDAPQGDQV